MAFQVRVPPPLLLILSVCVIGSCEPTGAVNASDVGLTVSAAEVPPPADVTVSVTGICCGLFDALPETVMAPTYVPPDRPEVLAVTLTVSVSVVVERDEAERTSHESLLAQLVDNVPPPGLVREMV